MYLVYIGESGNTGNSLSDSNQRHQVFSGLVIHENQYVAINGEFNALCRRHFGEPLGRGDSPAHLRPADIYQGRGFFRSWSPDKRAELIQDCLNILIRREAPVIITFVDKVQLAQARENGNEVVSNWATPPEAITSKFLFALNMYMDEAAVADIPPDHIMEATGPIQDYALVVAQTGKSVQPEYMSRFLHAEVEIPTPIVMEDLCYTSPGESVCTQLSNICAYFTRRWLQNPGGSHGYFDALRDGRVIQVVYPVQF